MEPRYHPIIDAVGDEWELAGEEGRKPDLNNIKIPAVNALCREVAAEHPEWSAKFSMTNLGTMRKMIDADNMWWLPRPQAAAAVPGTSLYVSMSTVHI
jgi:hypothetical protein